ncbi:MAG: hypothetical protein GQ574_19395 [Crocinitomix sp.]|nr:hypothetical protein [Crocinitomix sp.]
MDLHKKSFLNSQWVGIICILVASLFGGLWYNASYKSNVLEQYLDNPFSGGFNRAAQQDYQFYSKLYLIAGILLLALGLYIIRNYYLRTKATI